MCVFLRVCLSLSLSYSRSLHARRPCHPPTSPSTCPPAGGLRSASGLSVNEEGTVRDPRPSPASPSVVETPTGLARPSRRRSSVSPGVCTYDPWGESEHSGWTFPHFREGPVPVTPLPPFEVPPLSPCGRGRGCPDPRPFPEVSGGQGVWDRRLRGSPGVRSGRVSGHSSRTRSALED